LYNLVILIFALFINLFSSVIVQYVLLVINIPCLILCSNLNFPNYVELTNFSSNFIFVTILSVSE